MFSFFNGVQFFATTFQDELRELITGLATERVLSSHHQALRLPVHSGINQHTTDIAGNSSETWNRDGFRQSTGASWRAEEGHTCRWARHPKPGTHAERVTNQPWRHTSPSTARTPLSKARRSCSRFRRKARKSPRTTLRATSAWLPR